MEPPAVPSLCGLRLFHDRLAGVCDPPSGPEETNMPTGVGQFGEIHLLRSWLDRRLAYATYQDLGWHPALE
jgi:hypothetical protein